tara:strand:+ start:39282 stop:39551 length:270 start_codon:yes stop_codon:yes gene_type:complete
METQTHDIDLVILAGLQRVHYRRINEADLQCIHIGETADDGVFQSCFIDDGHRRGAWIIRYCGGQNAVIFVHGSGQIHLLHHQRLSTQD